MGAPTMVQEQRDLRRRVTEPVVGVQMMTELTGVMGPQVLFFLNGN